MCSLPSLPSHAEQQSLSAIFSYEYHSQCQSSRSIPDYLIHNLDSSSKTEDLKTSKNQTEIDDEFKRQIEKSGISAEVLMKTPIKDLNKLLKSKGLRKEFISSLKNIRRIRKNRNYAAKTRTQHENECQELQGNICQIENNNRELMHYIEQISKCQVEDSWFEFSGCLDSYEDNEGIKRIEKYQAEGKIRIGVFQTLLTRAHIDNLSPEFCINAEFSTFTKTIEVLSKHQQNICKEIRKKGKNKIHTLKCVRKQRSRLQILKERLSKMKNMNIILEAEKQRLHREYIFK